VPAANQWVQIQQTIAGETTGTWEVETALGLSVAITLAAGSNWVTSDVGRWQESSRAPSGFGYAAATGGANFMGTVNNQFYLTGVQVEKGTIMTGFEARPFGVELGLCQRYYQKGMATDVITPSSARGVWHSVWCYSTNTFTTNTVHLMVELRLSELTLNTNLLIYPNYASGGTVGQIGLYQGSWTLKTILIDASSSKHFALSPTSGQTVTIGHAYAAFNYIVNVEL